jgi:hypothetical protein
MLDLAVQEDASFVMWVGGIALIHEWRIAVHGLPITERRRLPPGPLMPIMDIKDSGVPRAG